MIINVQIETENILTLLIDVQAEVEFYNDKHSLKVYYNKSHTQYCYALFDRRVLSKYGVISKEELENLINNTFMDELAVLQFNDIHEN